MRRDIRNICLAILILVAVPLAFAFDKDAMDISEKDVRDKEGIVSRIPSTMEEADKMMPIAPVRSRFLLFTKDGTDVMWGAFGNGYFKGEDNHGKFTLGIYGKTVFAGFYDGEFFYGRYRNGNWKAFGLFGKKKSSGKYKVFPSPYPA